MISQKTPGKIIGKFSNLNVLIFCSLLFIISIGCDKQYAKKLAGDYYGISQYDYWDGTGINIDTTFSDTIAVTRSGKYLTILYYVIHVDSLRGGNEYYEGHTHRYIKVRFEDKIMYLTIHEGGLGGGGTLNFVGTKD